MNRPSDQILETVAPSREIDMLPISDMRSVRNVAHAEQLNTMRLPRGGDYDATLVVVRKFYDGSGGGEAGHYALVYVEFRATGSRWRTAGVKVRAEEGARIARDMLARKPSKPGRNEAPRVGGKTVATEESSLRGAPVDDGFFHSYAIYVRHKQRNDEWARTLGVEVLATEAPIVADLLKKLAKEAA